jgi:hypothetical protein
MKEFIEKLIGRLEESQERYDDVSFAQLNEFGHTLDYEYAKGKRDGVEESIEIVNQLAEEYNNGWIACEKELPKIPNSYLVTKMCDDDGKRIYETAHEIFWTSDGKWDCERDEDCEWKVIAWRKKLAPYQKGE